MGFFSNLLFGNNESHEQGGNWSDRVYSGGDDLSADEVAALAQEYGQDPQKFYNGYRKNWNEQARIHNMHVAWSKDEEPPEEPRRFFGLF